jgi:beta-lactamase superfamily II metal-dependent hydrolase
MRNGLLALLCLALTANGAELEIHYINVGWGGAVLVRGPNGTTVLLEGGNTGKGSSKVVPYLTSIGIQPQQGLDYVIGGHQHCDHVGGLDEVVNAGYNVHTRNYFNGSSTTSSCVTGWNAAAATTTAGAPVALPVGTVLQLGNGARITCVAVNGAIIGGTQLSVSDENDRSIALLIQYGGFDYLWASDLGGGDEDEACTGRSTSQRDVESSVIAAISPGGAMPLLSTGGVDVLHVNHHGSESSTNANYMNGARPEVAIISTGAGQSSNFELPRVAVVEHVLMATVACVTGPAALVLQTEEGSPQGPDTSTAGYSVGDIVIRTDGVVYDLNADGAVTQGPSEVIAAGLPRRNRSDNPEGFPAPANLLATRSGASEITLTWTPTPGADHYNVYRSDHGGAFALVGSSLSAAFTDSGRASDTTYLYKVRALSALGEESSSSNVDLATTVAFTDAALSSGTTTIRAVHYLELRTAVNAVRAAAGLSAFTFTDPSLAGMPVKAIHLGELRTALDAARAVIGTPAVTYGNTVTPGATPVRAAGILELRDGVK